MTETLTERLAEFVYGVKYRKCAEYGGFTKAKVEQSMRMILGLEKLV